MIEHELNLVEEQRVAPNEFHWTLVDKRRAQRLHKRSTLILQMTKRIVDVAVELLDSDTKKSKQPPADNLVQFRDPISAQFVPCGIVISITLFLPLIQSPCRINRKAVRIIGNYPIEGVANLEMEVGIPGSKGARSKLKCNTATKSTG